MKIHDSQTFSLIVPTFEGTRFLKRALDYFRFADFQGSIVLADNSSGEHRDFVASCAGQYPDLRIDVHLYPHGIRFLDKMVATLERTESRFVMLHAHDDFLVPEAAEQCVDFLDRNSGYSVARGRVAMFALTRAGDESSAGVSLVLGSHPMRAYEQANALDRVIDHIERFAPTFYSVHRREYLIEAFRLTEASTKNVIFFQYLSSCIAALQGKIWCSDELFYLRQAHDDSWSRSLLRDYEHWPMLITSPNFSRYYQQFRSALCTRIEQTLGTPATETTAAIDRAAIHLLARGFCGKERENPAEADFIKRLQQSGSAENRCVRSVAEFAAKYPDTI